MRVSTDCRDLGEHSLGELKGRGKAQAVFSQGKKGECSTDYANE